MGKLLSIIFLNLLSIISCQTKTKTEQTQPIPEKNPPKALSLADNTKASSQEFLEKWKANDCDKNASDSDTLIIAHAGKLAERSSEDLDDFLTDPEIIQASNDIKNQHPFVEEEYSGMMSGVFYLLLGSGLAIKTGFTYKKYLDALKIDSTTTLNQGKKDLIDATTKVKDLVKSEKNRLFDDGIKNIEAEINKLNAPQYKRSSLGYAAFSMISIAIGVMYLTDKKKDEDSLHLTETSDKCSKIRDDYLEALSIIMTKAAEKSTSKTSQ